jgi:predicted SnoaL-like aldol condensation-catalyzing enzyme
MSQEENKAMVRDFFEEVWNKGNLDHLNEVYSPDFKLHALWQNTSAGGAIEASGIEPAKQVIGGWLAGFPDMHVTVDDQVAEGDKVGSRHSSHGTHTNAFMGMPPTGKEATITGMTLTRIENGKMVEAWTCWDAQSKPTAGGL